MSQNCCTLFLYSWKSSCCCRSATFSNFAPISVKASEMACMDTYCVKPCRIKTAPRWNLVNPSFFSSLALLGITVSTSFATVVRLLHISFKAKEALTVFLSSPRSPISIKSWTLVALLTNFLRSLSNSSHFSSAGFIPFSYKNCSKRSRNLFFHRWNVLYFFTESNRLRSATNSASVFNGLVVSPSWISSGMVDKWLAI